MKDIFSPIVALLTPFDGLGQVDFSSLGVYLEYLSDKGVRAVIANGTTAEFASLSLGERRNIIEYCRSNFDGCIINNVSSPCISEVRILLQHSHDLADFALILPPYYYANQQVDGARAFFDAVIASTDQPVFLYNFPLHTQFEISTSLVEQLAVQHKNLVGIKDSSGSLDVANSFVGTRSPFSIFVGNDQLGFDVLGAGLAGSVTGAGSSFPECLVKIREHYSKGEIAVARDIQGTFNQWNVWRTEFGGDEIAVTKQVVATRLGGFPANVRPPVCALSDAEADKLKSNALAFEERLYRLLKQIVDRSN